MKGNRTGGVRARAALCMAAAALVCVRCDDTGPRRTSGRDAREMQITSDHTEIAVSASKVPGYWARQATYDQPFFLCAPAGDYKRGDIVIVKGPFGSAMAAVFDEEKRIYQKGPRPTHIVIVWEMARSDNPPSDKAPAGEGGRGR